MQRRAPYGRVWCRLRMRHCATAAPALRHSAATAPQVAALTDSSGGPGGKFSAAQIRYFHRVDINGEGETAIFATQKIFTTRFKNEVRSILQKSDEFESGQMGLK